MSTITINAGDKALNFNVETDDFNQYLNDLTPNDKVAPAYNFLAQTIDEKCQKDFKALVMRDGKPNGVVVLQIVGVIAEEFGAEVKISLKKQRA